MLESQMTMKELLASIDARYEKEACEAPTFEEIVEEAPVVEKKEVKKEKKEEKPKIYIPNFAFPFKRISKHDKEKSTYDLMMESLFIDKEAQYLFNRSGLFHGGVHLNGAKFCANTFDKENIRAIADGKVIAYRIDKEALENEVNAEYFSYTTGFFLLEHFMEYPVGNKLKFYSLYMHMAAMEEYEFPTYVLCGSKEYVKEGSASGVGIANTFGKEVTLTGEKVGDRFVIATLDGEKPSKKLVVHKSNLMRKKELHTTTTKGKGINLRYHQKNCKSWKSLKIATDELKAGVIIVVASKKLKCNRYEVISVDGKLIIESNDKEDKTKKVEQMVSISASNLTEVPKVPKKSKDSFENGLVSEKMETDKVVELEDKEQIKVKAGDVLGKLGFYSYDWIEEPMVHLEVFTFDDVKAFQKNATTAYEKEEEEEKYEVKGDDVPIVKGWRNSSSVLDEQKHYLKKGTAITVTKTKKKVGGVIRQEVIEINGSDELVKEGVWTIYEKQVIVKNKKQKERPTPNILYVPKETTEIFEKGYDDTIYAKVTKNTNIRKGTTNEGEIYGKKTTKKGTELVLGATTTETKVVKSKEKEAHSYYRQSVLEIAGKKVEGYSIHTAFFEIIEKDVFVPKESNQKLKTSIVKPIKNLKIEKDKDSTEYIEIAQNPKLYVKKYKNKKQTKSWFTHGVTLKMFDVMEKEGTDKIGIFEDTVSFYDQRESNSKTQIEKETLNPLFNEILGKLRIDKDKSGKLEAGELAGLMLTQEKQKELSYIVAKHESEWEDPTRFEALATFLDEMKATHYAKMMRDRTKNLSFFDDVMAMDFSPTFFHPLALVESMVGCINFIRYDALYASKGKGYKSEDIVSWSHYNDTIPLDKKIKGNSRKWGDVSDIVQRQVIDELVKQGKQNEFSKSEICLLIAIARTESGFNPDAAAGTTSASGIGQLVKATASRMGLINIFDMEDGIRALIKLFKENKNIAIKRGKNPLIWIYKYHHDGANGEYGGMKIVTEKITPLRVKFEKNINFCENNSQNVPSVLDSFSVDAWIFDRESWTLTSHDGSVKYSQVYAGSPGYKNKADKESLKNKGPIPKGLWKITGKRNILHGHKHANVLVLIPDKDTEVYGRSSFLIHGDNKTASGSNGCIILNGKDKRLKILNSGIKYILVK